ncbi:MAG: hypothetical protein L0Y66_11060 [Myxococcaceae bacterium]|nr:hypothetical protein [Myxococcaceae bacterium]MCI0673405.1 hypothetical protein [Myxococcaceae bacterium]
MKRRGSRFLHLENARRSTGGPEERARLEGGDRFSAPVARDEVGVAQERVSEAHVERFRHQGEVPMALDERALEDMPFRRCVRCEVDSSRYVTACSRCGADLETPEQRAFNAQLWQRRQQEAAVERVELEALRERPRLDPLEVERMMEQLRREAREGVWGWLVRWAQRARRW